MVTILLNTDTPSRHSAHPDPDAAHFRQYHDDEIDLVDIWRLLARRWQWIAAITLICTALALVYVLSAPRVYRAEASILPPRLGDVEPLNILGVNAKSAKDVYGEALKNLQSVSVRRLFFDQHNLFDSLKGHGDEGGESKKVFATAFHEKLTVTQGKKDRSDFVTVSMEGCDPALITSWLNDFLAMVNGYTAEVLLQDLNTNLGSRKEAIEVKINALRQVANYSRLDRIAELQEALYVAGQLGIVHRVDASSVFSQTKGTSEFGVAVNTANTPLYLRGTQELQAEIDTLQKRKINDPFIPSLRSLQAQLIELNQIQVDPDKVKAFRLDQPAVKPDGPIKPKRNLVVALGFVLGLMLGVFTAFAVNFIETARRQECTE
ncbi:MAG: hypothetical protein BM485_16990 [Desulfobulbaceae bacterium DB1]|nr:MAG: hypothetical protein BM485_16990 [Desulfobulbaceae bacterium DB1]